jgi:hypothetical protein
MAVTRRFRYLRWTLRSVEALGLRAHITCVSGSPPCGAEPDPGPGTEPAPLTPDTALDWAGAHFRATGHRRYERTVGDTVQWDPPHDTDPRALPEVTT